MYLGQQNICLCSFSLGRNDIEHQERTENTTNEVLVAPSARVAIMKRKQKTSIVVTKDICISSSPLAQITTRHTKGQEEHVSKDETAESSSRRGGSLVISSCEAALVGRALYWSPPSSSAALRSCEKRHLSPNSHDPLSRNW